MKFIDVILTIGIVSIIGAFIYIGRKLQILDDLKETMDKAKHNIKFICDSLTQSKIKFDPTYLRAFSPLQLTDKGIEIINAVEFNKIFNENKPDFINFINSENPKTRYDTELSSIKSIVSLFDKEYFYPVKKYLYENPGLDERSMRTILGVYVRDKYLEAHPEIK
jgi:hypothetical protein